MSATSFQTGQPAASVHASLKQSLQALEQAQKCAVLWFAEIMHRNLYRELGCSTINQYAMSKLGFSKSRTRDFIRLAGRLDKLPAVREAMSSGELGYSKAREIVAVATPETEDAWLKAARGTRKELVTEVKRVKQAARVDPCQGDLLPGPATVVSAKELPVRFQLDLTPEQEGRRSALVERLHKLGGAPSDRAELMLEALAVLVESREKGPRGPRVNRPPVQVHVHEDRGRLTVQTHVGERELSRPTWNESVAIQRFAVRVGGMKRRFRRAPEGRSWPVTGTAVRPPVAVEPGFSKSIISHHAARGAPTIRIIC